MMDDEDMEIPLPPGEDSVEQGNKPTEDSKISVLPNSESSSSNLKITTSTKTDSSKTKERSSSRRRSGDERNQSRRKSSRTESSRKDESSRAKRSVSPRSSNIGSKNAMLKYTYIALGLDNKEKSYPVSIIKYTKTPPSLAYCCNLQYETGIYDSRDKLLSLAESAVRDIMEMLMKGSGADVMAEESQASAEKGDQRKVREWYTEKIVPSKKSSVIVETSSVGVQVKGQVSNEERKGENGPGEKYDEFPKSLDTTRGNKVTQEVPSASEPPDEVQRYSPNWISDSDDDTQGPKPTPPVEKPIEKPAATAVIVPKIGLKLVPKSRIKIDLQIFADEDKPDDEVTKPAVNKTPEKLTSTKETELTDDNQKKKDVPDKSGDKEKKEETESKRKKEETESKRKKEETESKRKKEETESKRKKEEEEPRKSRSTAGDKKVTKETKERERKTPDRRRTDERRDESRQESVKNDSRRRETQKESKVSKTDRRSRETERESRERSRIESHSKGDSARRSRSPRRTERKSSRSRNDSHRGNEKRKRSPESAKAESKRRRSGSQEKPQKPRETEVPQEATTDAQVADQTVAGSAEAVAENRACTPPPAEEPVEPKVDPDAIPEESEDSIAKRISLDERLERELGIKPPVAEPSQEAVSLDCYQFAFMTEKELDNFFPTRRRGFGPKAAPMGPLVYSCPAVFPFRPYVPPHVEVLLFQRPAPLVQRAAPVEPVVPAAVDEVLEESKEAEANAPEENGNDWDGKLKLLEEAANNLESGDETVLEDIEEKLLLFEAMSIVPGKEDSPPPPVRPKQKRSKPKPITLKAAEKGILIMPRFTLEDKTATVKQRSVVFADNVRPGDGTSSSGGEELYSPPPPMEAAQEKPRKRKKKKKKAVQEESGDVSDSEFDRLPPPPPPPGSPPPHLLRYREAAQAEPVHEQLPSGESPPPPPPGED